MPEEFLQPQDQYYIHYTSARLDDRKRVLKHGDTFAVFDRYGNIEPFGRNEYGVFHQDTRFLSRLAVRLRWDGEAAIRLRLLSSAVKSDNAILTVHLTNPDVEPDQPGGLVQGSLHLLRTQALWRSALFDRLRIHNYGDRPVRFLLDIACEADFADIFEVRGIERERRGDRAPPAVDVDALLLAYRGLDNRRRRTRIHFDPAPSSLTDVGALYEVALEPHAATTLQWAVHCEGEEGTEEAAKAEESEPPAVPLQYETVARQVQDEVAAARSAEAVLYTSNAQFNELLDRSRADLYMLTTQTPHGVYPYAGVPWFSTPFGRDGIITALQSLWLAPDLARGVLAFLAATQAIEENALRDAQPGKILHETRGGEMAALGEVPFGRYYGSVDSTPLFAMLAGAYFARTGDTDFMRAIWPNVERALDWIDRYGDADRDGFVEYARLSERGLVNQGWKDSHDAVFHDTGILAEPPIALCEVQGYVYAARIAAAMVAQAIGRAGVARRLREQAKNLRAQFERAFWCEELGTYALALDGRKRPCRVPTSNAGHCLYTTIASAEHAHRVAETLMSEPGFSGWGIRTVQSIATKYNPMSYHNGSVWPHDNSLIASGLSRYGRHDQAARILEGLFDASLYLDLRRLPELFCGFTRQPGENPTLYPQACSPQAWAAAAPLLCLQACLGLEVCAIERTVRFQNPFLPDFLHRICIERLRVCDAWVDLEVVRHQHDVAVRLTRREGDVKLVVQM